MLFAFDGTGNKDNPGLKFDTNVLKFVNAYEGVIFYQEGVGSGGWFDRIWGGLTGYGGKSRVEKAIKMVEKDPTMIVDVIGFSRGSALALDFCNAVNKRFKGSVRIRFVGLFDTVASFGIPGNNINIGYNFSLPHCVVNCYHALALDERREMFPLTRVHQDSLTNVKPSNIVQCWFRGFHSDIGGGNGNDGLSDISLHWMISMAKAAGCNMWVSKIWAGAPTTPCEKPIDMIANDKRVILRTDVVHVSVYKRKLACEGFDANNPPEDMTIVGNS